MFCPGESTGGGGRGAATRCLVGFLAEVPFPRGRGVFCVWFLTGEDEQYHEHPARQEYHEHRGEWFQQMSGVKHAKSSSLWRLRRGRAPSEYLSPEGSSCVR